MKRINISRILFVSCLFSSLLFYSLQAEATETIRLFIPSVSNNTPFNVPAVPGAQYGAVNTFVLNQLRSQQEVEIADVPLSDRRTVTLSLHSFTAFTPDAKFVAVTNTGEVQLPAPDASLFQGKVAGDDKSIAFLGIYDNKVTGFVSTGGHRYEIGIVGDNSNGGTNYQIYDVANVPPSLEHIHCATPEGDFPALNTFDSKQVKTSSAETQSYQVHIGTPHIAASQFLARIAVDMDYEAFQFFGNTTACEQYISQLFGAISAVYESEADVQLSVSYLRIWQTSSEPYTKQDYSSALSEMAVYWQQNMDTVSRATAVLISKKPMCGSDPNSACGVAYVNQICNNSLGYALAAVSGNGAFPDVDQKVVAHEVGHNFGCHHTQSCWWIDIGVTTTPIDECAPAEEGNCFAGTSQTTGTIMSYCNVKDFTFGDIVGPWLKTHVDSIANAPGSCLLHGNELAVSDTLIDYGVQRVGVATDSTMDAFLVNGTQQSITIRSMAISGPNKNNFSVVSGGGTSVIPPGGGLKLVIRFKPDSVGDRYATLTISHTAPNSPITVSLHGIGGVSDLVLAQDTLGWNTPTGATEDQLLFIINDGSVPLNVKSTTISGPDSALFAISSGGAPFEVDPRGQVQMDITYSPNTSGITHATLKIKSDADDSIQTVTLLGGVVLSVADGMANPQAYSLEQNFPNPVVAGVTGSGTTLRYWLPERTRISLALYDVYGRMIVDLASGVASAGMHLQHLDISTLPSGNYYYKLQTSGQSFVRMMTVMR